MIADTSFVIDLMKNDSKAVAKMQSLLGSGQALLTTSLTIFELSTGVARSSNPNLEQAKINRSLRGLEALPLTPQAAMKGGEIHGRLIKGGNRISSMDALMAAIAIVKQDFLLTRNVKDFCRIKELHLETY